MEDYEMEKTKAGLLEKYEQKEPNLFIQYDGYDYSNNLDAQQHLEEIVGKSLDIDKHFLEANLAYELMWPADIRIFINPEVSTGVVLKLLDKIKNRIKKNKDCKIGVTGELCKFNTLKELESTLKRLTSENGYTLDDIEYLYDSIKVMRDKKRQVEKKTKGRCGRKATFLTLV